MCRGPLPSNLIPSCLLQSLSPSCGAAQQKPREPWSGLSSRETLVCCQDLLGRGVFLSPGVPSSSLTDKLEHIVLGRWGPTVNIT